jgi:hypothetical protein
MYSNRKDQINLEEVYKAVHNPELLKEDQFETINLTGTLLFLGSIGAVALVNEIKKLLNSEKTEEKRKEFEKIAVNETFKKLLNNIETIHAEKINAKDKTVYANKHVELTQAIQYAKDFAKKYKKWVDSEHLEKRLDQAGI